MKKILLITSIFLITITIHAQNTAKPNKVAGVDVYALLVNTNTNKFVGNSSLTMEQLETTISFENRIELIMENAPANNYDGVTTRDGITFQFFKYEEKEQHAANVPKYFGIEVYFLSTPYKSYEVIDSRLATSNELKGSFYLTAQQLVKNGLQKEYDAIIVTENKIEYIRYN